MTNKHTPGPWQVNKKVKTTVETCADGQGINIIADCSDVDGIRSRAEDQANAALIAQCPDLLAERDRLRQVNAELVAALEWIVKSLTLAGDPELACQEYQLGIARAALAKAKGE